MAGEVDPEAEAASANKAFQLANRIIGLAGYPIKYFWDRMDEQVLRETGGPFYDLGNAIFAAAREVWVRKRQDYGDSRYVIREDVPDFDYKMLFSDIHRKYLRLDELVWKRPQNPDMLIETLSDLMVYCMMGILITHEKEKRDAECSGNGS
jgi:hypothetical protein